MSKILVTGATGRLGNQVVEALLKKTDAANISVLVRDSSKAVKLQQQGVNVLTGDYNDYGSLVAAFAGIDKLYLVSSNDLENWLKQHQQVIKAAKEAGVKHIIYTSFQRKTETLDSALSLVSQSHLDTEATIVASGLTYTILRHALYADIIPDFAGSQVLENHTLLFPAGEGKTAFATSGDMAAGGAAVLAKMTKVNSGILSRIINTGRSLNFNDYINRYRVSEVIIRFELKQHQRITLLGIALECGFNSKATFNRAFKSTPVKRPLSTLPV